MAFTYGFFNSKNHDRRYDATQMSAIFDGILVDGVLHSVGNVLAVVPGDGMSVVVKSGRAWFNHTWSYNDGPLILSIAAADVTLKRYDAVVLEVNSNESVRANSLKVIKGSPASSPSKPALTNTATVHQHVLAYVLVEPGVTSIAANKIDIRVGTSETPFCTGLLQTASIDDLFQVWQADFDAWFTNLKAQLSDNVVANLQKQIDEKVAKSDKATSSDIANGTSGKWVDASGLKAHNDKLVVPSGELTVTVENANNVLMPSNNIVAITSVEIGSDIIVYCNTQYGWVFSKSRHKVSYLEDLRTACNPLKKRAFGVNLSQYSQSFTIFEIVESSNDNGYNTQFFISVDIPTHLPQSTSYSSVAPYNIGITNNYIVVYGFATYNNYKGTLYWLCSININTKVTKVINYTTYKDFGTFVSDLYLDYVYTSSDKVIYRIDASSLSITSSMSNRNLSNGFAYNGYAVTYTGSIKYNASICRLSTGSVIRENVHYASSNVGLIKNHLTNKYYLYIAPTTWPVLSNTSPTDSNLTNGTIVLVDVTNGAISSMNLNSTINGTKWFLLSSKGRSTNSCGDTAMGLKGYIYITTAERYDTPLNRTYVIRLNSSNQPVIENIINGLPMFSKLVDSTHAIGTYYTEDSNNSGSGEYSMYVYATAKPGIYSEVL